MIRFRLNGREVEVQAPPSARLLDVLRGPLGLPGTKEGCREGDCGACAVLFGPATSAAGHRRAVCSCLVPMVEVEGGEVLTVEGFAAHPDDWVRAALVDAHAAQCGYCTPGLVVTLEAFLASAEAYDGRTACEAVSGQLCRCTGYVAIRRACEALAERAHATLPSPPPPDSDARIEALERSGAVPVGLFAAREDATAPAPTSASVAHPAVLIGGGTDLLVARDPWPDEVPLASTRSVPALRGIRLDGASVDLGAATTFEELVRHPDLRARIAALARFEALVASPPIRARATLGGNLAHASPAADAAVLLLALDADLALEGGDAPRRLPLDAFFLGYRKTALADGERIARILLSLPDESERVAFEKVAKRAHLDVASVCSASRLRVEDGVVTRARLAAGGVAPTPLLLARAGRFLEGRTLDADVAWEAARIAADESSPIDDLRGSARYKKRLLGRLVVAQLAASHPRLADVLGSMR